MVQWRLAKGYCFGMTADKLGLVFQVDIAEHNCVQHQSYHHTENSNQLSWIVARTEINVI